MQGLPEGIFRRWVHARAEDDSGVEVYRPRGYPLPPARGRAGIEFRPDGTFVDWRIGRGDAGAPEEARWEAVAPSSPAAETATVVRILRSAAGSAEEVEVVEVGPDALRIRRRRG